MTRLTVASWGRVRQALHEVRRPAFLDQAREALQGPRPQLCYGMGRSYGDVCMNANGGLIVTSSLDRFMSIDRERGVVRAEAGLTLERLLRVTVPHGWFVPVAPGTKHVTLGGAVANDVHGKNHETAGTFGCHVVSLGLARSSGEVLTLSRDRHAGLFAATVGGLGLTGLILWVELQLVPIRSAFVEMEALPVTDLGNFFRLAESSAQWPYTVAWVDCLAKGRAIGRGVFFRGRHDEHGERQIHRGARAAVPFDAPGALLNSCTIGLFNELYRRRPWVFGEKRVHYDSFFFPLDAIDGWNRLYGRRGFYQQQCVVPMPGAASALERLLQLCVEHGEGSFLVVLKLFGTRPSPGLLSFPMPGATLALDFPNKGASTSRLLARMAEQVAAVGGRLYPAKDATMPAEVFRAGYPAWKEVEAQRDPAMMSDFWRRVAAVGDA